MENDSVIKEYVGSMGSTGRGAILRPSQGDAGNLEPRILELRSGQYPHDRDVLAAGVLRTG